MKILAMKSSGDRTSVSVVLNDEINSYSMTHQRKERPNWEMFLSNIGLNKTFTLKEIDLFAFANNQNSYTATRTIASYMKGLAVALEKPLISIKDENIDDFDADSIALKAKEIFLKEGVDFTKFNPKDANPSYEEKTKFKKLNE
tara:strand:- start:1740 stop:2171 length:432 start_codon:yes stop_codon:yes gene_type:complete